MAHLSLLTVFVLTAGLLGVLGAPKNDQFQQVNNEKEVSGANGVSYQKEDTNTNHAAGKNECAGRRMYMKNCTTADGLGQGKCDYRADKMYNEGHKYCRAWCGPPTQEVEGAGIEGLAAGMNETRFFGGKSLTYTCAGNYVAEGTTTIYCLSSGWTQADFKCVIDCGEPAADLFGANSYVETTPDPTTENSIATGDCDEGYEVVGGSMAATCQDGEGDNKGTGTWVKGDGACEQVCPEILSGIANAAPIDSTDPQNIFDNAVVPYKCKTNYANQDDEPVYEECVGGAWQANGACVYDCGSSFPPVDNGTPIPTCATTKGNTVTYNCDYADGETRTSTCEEGTGWSQPPACPAPTTTTSTTAAPTPAPTSAPTPAPTPPPTPAPDCDCTATYAGEFEVANPTTAQTCFDAGNTVEVTCASDAVSTTGETTTTKTCQSDGSWAANPDLGCWSISSECSATEVSSRTNRNNDNKGYLYNGCCIYPMENNVLLYNYAKGQGSATAVSYCNAPTATAGYDGELFIPQNAADWLVLRLVADDSHENDNTWVGLEWSAALNTWASAVDGTGAQFINRPITEDVTPGQGVCLAFIPSAGRWKTTECTTASHSYKAVCKICRTFRSLLGYSASNQSPDYFPVPTR